MWKKDETPKSPPAKFDADEGKKPAPASFSGGQALIGRSLVVEGSITGEEDLLVEGRIEGDVSLPNNTVTVGESGRVNATIEAKVVIVKGSVEGDLKGGEQVEIHQSGHVQGNIISPRVGLEDGAQFKGNIDMSPKSGSKPASSFGAGEPRNPTSDQAKNEQPAGKTSDTKLPG